MPFRDIRASVRKMPFYVVLGNHDEELRGILPEELMIEVPADHFSTEVKFMNDGHYAKRVPYFYRIPLSFGESISERPYENKRGIRILLVHGHRYMNPSIEEMGKQKNLFLREDDLIAPESVGRFLIALMST